jgi:predicted PurR-regulated permease PerM
MLLADALPTVRPVRIRRFRGHGRGGEREPAPATAGGPAEPVVELDEAELRQLSAVFSAPRWLRDLGFGCWLVVGVVALTVGVIWILDLTSTIVEPVLAGLLLAVVASPAVAWATRHGVPRAAGALLVLLGLVAVAALITFLVVSGITGQMGAIEANASAALDTIESWLQDVGVDASGAASAASSTQSTVPEILGTLIHGVAEGISGIAGLIFGLSFAVFSLFFLLKDGPVMRTTVERHLGVPEPVARVVTGGVIDSLRRYFLGVTIVGLFNAACVAIGAVVLGVPLAGTIALVTFVTAYVPYLGAFVAGLFAFVIALGGAGTTDAVILLLVFLLANGPLQQIVQPFALGAALRLNPLVVLVVTVGAGCLFGMVGLVLAAPLTAAWLKITTDLARARAGTRTTAGAGPPTTVQEGST